MQSSCNASSSATINNRVRSKEHHLSPIYEGEMAIRSHQILQQQQQQPHTRITDSRIINTNVGDINPSSISSPSGLQLFPTSPSNSSSSCSLSVTSLNCNQFPETSYDLTQFQYFPFLVCIISFV